MAQLERGSSPRVVDIEADAFDMATNNCASRTCTPHFLDLYEVESVDNARLTSLGTGKVTHMGKARYVFLDDDGKEIIIDDHKVIVCPNFPSRILSILSWGLQLENKYGPQDKTSIKSTGQLNWIQTNQNRVKPTITHHEKGIPIVWACLADDASYSTFSACLPCYNGNVVSDDEDSDYHVVT
jgi:hypothetical protein